MKLIAAMSGGVDSAVAASRAKAAGHDVIGVHLALAKNPQKYRSSTYSTGTIPTKYNNPVNWLNTSTAHLLIQF